MPKARLAFCLALFFLTLALLPQNALAFQGAAPTHLQSEGMTEPLGNRHHPSPALMAASGFATRRTADRL